MATEQAARLDRHTDHAGPFAPIIAFTRQEIAVAAIQAHVSTRQPGRFDTGVKGGD